MATKLCQARTRGAILSILWLRSLNLNPKSCLQNSTIDNALRLSSKLGRQTPRGKWQEGEGGVLEIGNDDFAEREMPPLKMCGQFWYCYTLGKRFSCLVKVLLGNSGRSCNSSSLQSRHDFRLSLTLSIYLTVRMHLPEIHLLERIYRSLGLLRY